MRTTSRLWTMIAVVVITLSIGIATAIADQPVANPGNGHYYDLFFAEGISWADASAQANGTDLNGCQGYLVTVSSAQENAFLVTNFGNEMGALGFGYWLGGYQDPGVGPATAGWKWVTGEPWGYTNWRPGEPNDVYGYASEQHAVVAGDGLWNDEAYLANIRGYIVECTPQASPSGIDIKPGDPTNTIVLSERGKVPVAVLSTDQLNAPEQIARQSLTFGRTGDEKSLLLRKGDVPNCSAEDVNGDQRVDLVCWFLVKLTDFHLGVTEGILRGSTLFDSPIEGRDMVNIVP